MADSSSEWNENKTIIQRMSVQGGQGGCDSFREVRPISVMGHVHLRQEKSGRRCPWDPHYPFAFGSTETPPALTRPLWETKRGGIRRVLKAQGPLFPLPSCSCRGTVSESSVPGGSELPRCLTRSGAEHGAVAAARQGERRAAFSRRRRL